MPSCGRHRACWSLSPRPPARPAQHRPGEGAPGNWAGGEEICPPCLFSTGTKVKREQLSVPIDLFPCFPPSFNTVSKGSLLASGAGRLKPRVNCSVAPLRIVGRQPPAQPDLHGFNGFILSTPQADEAQRSRGIHQQSGRRRPGGEEQTPRTPGARREAGISYALFW